MGELWGFYRNKYCQNLLDNFLNINADCCQGQSNEEELKAIIVQEFGRQHKHCIKKELYLNITFSEKRIIFKYYFFRRHLVVIVRANESHTREGDYVEKEKMCVL